MQPEDLAQSLCRRAGLPLERPLAVDQLVAACLGPRAIRVADPGTLHAHTKLVRLGSSWRIYVQRGIPQKMEVGGVLRCLVEWELSQRECKDADREGLVAAATQLLDEAVDYQALAPKRAAARKSSPHAAGGPRKTGKRPGNRTRRAG
jgi:hypothetical protein